MKKAQTSEILKISEVLKGNYAKAGDSNFHRRGL
jgi:hypothetical protein